MRFRDLLIVPVAAAAIIVGCDDKAAPAPSGAGGAGSPSAGTPGAVAKFTDANFQTEVLSAKGPVLVDFWAEWCGPCKMLAPTIDELAGEYGDRLKVGKLDTDANPKMSQQFQATAIPMVLVFKDGKIAKKIIGLESKATYKAAIDAAMK